ncbi:sugar ABC transporter permease [Paenibacillus filicis]|uniref:Sugar ABC transporter permease n=1 Tax=Paenibacillus filicis TaxID=669464 RepID=A0ABU9DGK5_9BACL
MIKRETGTGLLLLSPGLILYIGFMIVPTLTCLYYSLYDWDGFSERYGFVGLGNYARALTDHNFLQSIEFTLIYTLLTAVLINVLGLGFALMLNRQGWLTRIYRSIFFFPLLLSAVVVGFLWQTILNYNGVLNAILPKIGLTEVEFFSDRYTAMMTLAGITIWHSLGFVIVLYLAGLQGVPRDLMEASLIDGATKRQMFWNVTFPMLAPSTTMNIIFAITGGMKEYDKIATVTRGGPAGRTESMAYRVVNEAFVSNHFSYASSLAMYMLLMVMVISISCTLYLRRREERIL